MRLRDLSTSAFRRALRRWFGIGGREAQPRPRARSAAVSAGASEADRAKLEAAVEAQLPELAELWGVPELAQSLSFRHNARLRTTLGRFVARNRRVELNPRIWQALAPAQVRELIVHEAAHAVLFSRDPRARAHGADWRELMRRAGMKPRARLPRHCLLSELRSQPGSVATAGSLR